MKAAQPGQARSGWLCLILAVSYALRTVLIWRGGHRFWPDETRYDRSLEAVAAALGHNWPQALRWIFGSADHLGYKLMGVVPGFFQLRFHLAAGWSQMFFAVFATANIAWVARIARQAGADETEALGAALAMACSNAMFYWSRHFVPYDLAMFWGLACLSVSLRPSAGWRGSLAAGFLGFVTFATYNGYWLLVAVALSIHVLLALPRAGRVLWRAGWALLGLGGSFLLLLIAAETVLKVSLLQSYLDFAGTISQGDFDGGLGVLVEYLLSAETALALVWVGAAVLLVLAARSRRIERRGWLWLAAACSVCVVLVTGSNVLHKFVVYGRLTRQVIPFCSLLTGYVWFHLWLRTGKVRSAFAVLLVGVAAWNFAGPLRQEFPEDFIARGQPVIAAWRLRLAAAKGTPPAPADFRFIYTNFYWPLPPVEPVPPGSLVLRARPHPMQYGPYQYEGYNRVQRAALNALDFRMRLLFRED